MFCFEITHTEIFMSEKNYDFRKFLDEVHQKDLRDFSLKPRAD